MALPANQQLRIWSIAIVVFLVVMWFLGDVILPFVLGGAVAYLLDPIADWLQKRGLSRIAATILISVCAVLVFAIAVLLNFGASYVQETQVGEVAEGVAAEVIVFPLLHGGGNGTLLLDPGVFPPGDIALVDEFFEGDLSILDDSSEVSPGGQRWVQLLEAVPLGLIDEGRVVAVHGCEDRLGGPGGGSSAASAAEG